MLTNIIEVKYKNTNQRNKPIRDVLWLLVQPVECFFLVFSWLRNTSHIRVILLEREQIAEIAKNVLGSDNTQMIKKSPDKYININVIIFPFQSRRRQLIPVLLVCSKLIIFCGLLSFLC